MAAGLSFLFAILVDADEPLLDEIDPVEALKCVEKRRHRCVKFIGAGAFVRFRFVKV